MIVQVANAFIGLEFQIQSECVFLIVCMQENESKIEGERRLGITRKCVRACVKLFMCFIFIQLTEVCITQQ